MVCDSKKIAHGTPCEFAVASKFSGFFGLASRVPGAASFKSCRAGGFLVFQCFVYRPWPTFVRSFVASHRSVAVGSLPAALSDFSAFACSCNGHMSYICPLCSCRLSCLCFRPRLSNSGFQVSYPGSVVALPVRVLLPQRKQLRRRLLFRSLDSLEWINV